jgi:hypothetical protein
MRRFASTGLSQCFRRMMWSCAVLVFATAIGCGGGTPKTLPVDATKAREALNTALDAWKQGQTPDSLQKLTPPVNVLDADWVNGAKLTAYTVTSEGVVADNKLSIPVALTLQDSRGAKVEKSVIYIVATSPSLSILRNFLQ